MRTPKKKRKSYWDKIIVTLILVMKEGKLLLGKIEGGTIAGFVTPPGGKFERCKDASIEESARRELKEETGLHAEKMIRIGQVAIKIIKKRKILYLNVFKCKSYTGRLKICKREFSWMKFYPIGRVPWDKFAPGDRSWMEEIIANCRKIKASIVCDKNRKDLKEIHIRIIP